MLNSANLFLDFLDALILTFGLLCNMEHCSMFSMDASWERSQECLLFATKWTKWLTTRYTHIVTQVNPCRCTFPALDENSIITFTQEPCVINHQPETKKWKPSPTWVRRKHESLSLLLGSSWVILTRKRSEEGRVHWSASFAPTSVDTCHYAGW